MVAIRKHILLKQRPAIHCHSKKTEMTSIQRHVSDDEMQKAIQGGITFKGAKLKGPAKEEKVKTKAKKKTYITGTHGSASARHKAEIRQRRANRHKNK